VNIWLHALQDGLVFSLLMGGVVTLIQWINPRLELHNYPPQIQTKVPPKTEAEKKHFRKLALPMSLILLGWLLYALLRSTAKFDLNFAEIWSYAFLMLMTFSLFDLIVLDWLIFSLITPKYLVIPGTEGDPAYKDWRFHINGSLGKGLMVAVLAATILAGVVWLLIFVFQMSIF
jgi:hypothetical protein